MQRSKDCLISMIIFYVISGFIFPLEAIPEYVRPLSYIIAFTYFVEIIRGLLIKHTLITDLLYAYVALAVFCLLFVMLSIVKFKEKI